MRKCLNPTKFKGSLQFNLGGSLLKSFYKNDFFHKSFSIFKGSFGDQAYFNSNIVLPTTLFSETNSIFFNVEGICQFLNQAVVGPGSCRNSLDIIKAIYTFYIFKIYKNFYKLNNFIISIFKFFNIIQYYWFVFTYKNLSELNVCLNFFFQKSRFFSLYFFNKYLNISCFYTCLNIIFDTKTICEYFINNPILNYSKLIKINLNMVKRFNKSFNFLI